MKIFISAIYPQDLIICPFLGLDWNGNYENLSNILKEVAVKDGKVIPFKISVLQTNRELIFNHKVMHPDASNNDSFFLFNNKKLINSSSKLKDLFN